MASNGIRYITMRVDKCGMKAGDSGNIVGDNKTQWKLDNGRSVQKNQAGDAYYVLFGHAPKVSMPPPEPIIGASNSGTATLTRATTGRSLYPTMQQSSVGGEAMIVVSVRRSRDIHDTGTFFQLKPTAPLRRLMRSYCKRHELTDGIFTFGARSIAADSTPQQLGMGDGAVIYLNAAPALAGDATSTGTAAEAPAATALHPAAATAMVRKQPLAHPFQASLAGLERRPPPTPSSSDPPSSQPKYGAASSHPKGIAAHGSIVCSTQTADEHDRVGASHSFRVHRGLKSFKGWLHSIPRSAFARGNVAVILGGSTDIYDARKLLRSADSNVPSDARFEILHAHLHGELDAPIEPNSRTVLLATEAFYGREALRSRFGAIYDDCQVHRLSVLDFEAFGLAECLRTYMASAPELTRRHEYCVREGVSYHPRMALPVTHPDIRGCAASEPTDLASQRTAAVRCIEHPMLGFPLLTPRLRTGPQTTALAHERGRGRLGDVTINALPLANLLDAARDYAQQYSDVERLALVALVAAAQVTAALPHLFGDPARASFHDAARVAFDVNVAVLLRAFLSDCGRSADEVGLACLYLLHCNDGAPPGPSTSRTAEQPSAAQQRPLRNLEGDDLGSYFARPEEVHPLLRALLAATDEVVSDSIARLRTWSHGGRSHGHRAGGVGLPHPRAIDAGSVGRYASFLEARFEEAARRSHERCYGFVLDVVLTSSDTPAPIPWPDVFLGTEPRGTKHAGGEHRGPEHAGPEYAGGAEGGTAAGGDMALCKAEIAQQLLDFERRRAYGMRNDASHESRTPHDYELRPVPSEGGRRRTGHEVHIRLAARPLWTCAAAAVRKATGERKVGTLAYLRRRLILDRDDVCLLEATLFTRAPAARGQAVGHPVLPVLCHAQSRWQDFQPPPAARHQQHQQRGKKRRR